LRQFQGWSHLEHYRRTAKMEVSDEVDPETLIAETSIYFDISIKQWRTKSDGWLPKTRGVVNRPPVKVALI
jgi:hypothetical protein